MASSTHRQRRQVFGARPSGLRTDLARFQPNTPLARRQVDELVRRGAVVLDVRAAMVTLRRAAQTARVDAWGRVEWMH